jgi:hypothetical protein
MIQSQDQISPKTFTQFVSQTALALCKGIQLRKLPNASILRICKHRISRFRELMTFLSYLSTFTILLMRKLRHNYLMIEPDTGIGVSSLLAQGQITMQRLYIMRLWIWERFFFSVIGINFAFCHTQQLWQFLRGLYRVGVQSVLVKP